MNIRGLKIQRLKRDIEETRKKLTVLLDRDVLDITEDVLDISRKLDNLIADYYCMMVKNEWGKDFIE